MEVFETELNYDNFFGKNIFKPSAAANIKSLTAEFDEVLNEVGTPIKLMQNYSLYIKNGIENNLYKDKSFEIPLDDAFKKLLSTYKTLFDTKVKIVGEKGNLGMIIGAISAQRNNPNFPLAQFANNRNVKQGLVDRLEISYEAAEAAKEVAEAEIEAKAKAIEQLKSREKLGEKIKLRNPVGGSSTIPRPTTSLEDEGSKLKSYLSKKNLMIVGGVVILGLGGYFAYKKFR